MDRLIRMTIFTCGAPLTVSGLKYQAELTLPHIALITANFSDFNAPDDWSSLEAVEPSSPQYRHHTANH